MVLVQVRTRGFIVSCSRSFGAKALPYGRSEAAGASGHSRLFLSSRCRRDIVLSVRKHRDVAELLPLRRRFAR